MISCSRILRANSLGLPRCPLPLLRSCFSSSSSSPFAGTPPLLRRHDESIADVSENDSPKLFVVQPRLRPDELLHSKLSEALNLANSLDEQRDGFFSTDLALKPSPPHVVVQNPLASSSKWTKSRAATYFGTGTIKTIHSHILAAESENNLDAIFVNAMLSGTQQRNLEKSWEKPVLDRVALIIEIFHAHAYTKEAKLQAELAALMYKNTRLVRERGSSGRGTFDGGSEVVSARGRGSGGTGFISGAGETELELQRRRISERRLRLLGEIYQVRRTRSLQRASRKRRGGSDGQGLATIAIVGYTNAGKSTLVSVLSDSDLYTDDRLFATVDPRSRGMTLPSGRRVLLSDTVGFISDLPVQLIEAFHATLEEVAEADLLVHVLDSTASNLEEHKSAVLQVLKQIGVADDKIQNMVEVWNKIDNQGKLDSAEYSCNDEMFITDNMEDEYQHENENHNDDEVGDASGVDDKEMEEAHSDVWLGSDGNDSDSKEEQAHSTLDGSAYEIESVQSEGTPHVKTSAVTGVGLQELLELIDEKLVAIDEKDKSNRMIGRGEFDRKWRPSRVKEADTAVEG